MGPFHTGMRRLALSPMRFTSVELPASTHASKPPKCCLKVSPSVSYSWKSATPSPRRSPYGGFTIKSPRAPSAWCSQTFGGRASASPRRSKRTMRSTPASEAPLRASVIASSSTSLPRMVTARCPSASRPRRARACASASTRRNTSSWCPRQPVNPKRGRSSAGATSATMRAASMSHVPLPHMGSSSTSRSRDQPAMSSSAAARFSFSGARAPRGR
jgi:hypothetical protein